MTGLYKSEELEDRSRFLFNVSVGVADIVDISRTKELIYAGIIWPERQLEACEFLNRFSAVLHDEGVTRRG